MQKNIKAQAQFASKVLVAAAIYNLIWGALVVLFPVWSFELSGSPAPLNAIFLWQCIGMIVGVYGIGYAIAATSPLQHWPIVLVGLLGKIFGPIGFIWSYYQGAIELGFVRHIIFNDLIWLIPFSVILLQRYSSYISEGAANLEDEKILGASFNTPGLVADSQKITVSKASENKPLLVVFFRHAGCCFCRELLDDVAKMRAEIEANSNLAFVFMEQTQELTKKLAGLSLGDIPIILDPSTALYRSAGMARAELTKLFGLREMLRAVSSVLRFGVGNLAGDGFMLPGSLLVYRGKIIKRSLPSRASEQPSLCLWDNAKKDLNAS